MPEYRDNRRSITSLYGTIGDRNPIGQSLHWRMYDVLSATFGHRLAMVQMDLLPIKKYNVLTTWALDRKSSEHLRMVFEDRWGQESTAIENKWNSIQQEGSHPPRYIPGTKRPPLS